MIKHGFLALIIAVSAIPPQQLGNLNSQSLPPAPIQLDLDNDSVHRVEVQQRNQPQLIEHAPNFQKLLTPLNITADSSPCLSAALLQVTTQPTTAPTTQPTAVPTTQQTSAPTTAPTGQPTTASTTVPTTQPTAAPTTAPTNTATPTRTSIAATPFASRNVYLPVVNINNKTRVDMDTVENAPTDQVVNPIERFVDTARTLYIGSNARQKGVAANAINDSCVSILRGKVLDGAGNALAGVTISVPDSPQYGSTSTQSNGEFFIAVNGGETINLRYQKDGFLRVDRQTQAPWQDFAVLKDVTMLPYDSKVSSITSNANTMQVAQGSVINDKEGQRQATLLIPAGTQATMVLPNGMTQTLTSMNIRVTEYTVGAAGPSAMPGTLPPNSGYTYAFEYSVDQAEAAGAVEVKFSTPLYHYVDNFLNFPVGIDVPTGYYDRVRQIWVPSDSGKVIKIIAIANGMAEVDSDGDGVADNNSALGFTNAERQKLATLYAVGKTLWRAPIPHFTPWDCNWPFGPPDDAEPPEPPPSSDNTDDDQKSDTNKGDDCRHTGSDIFCQSQILNEDVDIVGVPFGLHYSSEHVQGRKTKNAINISLTKATYPTSVKGVEFEVTIAGKQYTGTVSPAPSKSVSIAWDGKDVFGNKTIGARAYTLRVGYTYDGVYQRSSRFGSSAGSIPITGSRTRQQVTLWAETKGSLSVYDAQSQGFGGWTPNILQRYDPVKNVLYKGNGVTLNTEAFQTAPTIQTIFGKYRPLQPYEDYHIGDFMVDNDNALFLADYAEIRKINLDGITSTIAGTGFCCSNGDGKPANQARIGYLQDIKFGPDNALYIAADSRLRRIDATGIITTIAGTGLPDWWYSGDGVPALSANISVGAIAFGPDRSIYIVSSNTIKHILPSGIITTVAGILGRNTSGYTGDGGLAISATFASPSAVAVDATGNLFIADSYNNRVRKVDIATGIITTVVGNGEYIQTTTNNLATSTAIGSVHDVHWRTGNQLIINASNGIFKVDLNKNIITTLISMTNQSGSSYLSYKGKMAIDVMGNLYIAGTKRVNTNNESYSLGLTRIAFL